MNASDSGTIFARNHTPQQPYYYRRGRLEERQQRRLRGYSHVGEADWRDAR